MSPTTVIIGAARLEVRPVERHEIVARDRLRRSLRVIERPYGWSVVYSTFGKTTPAIDAVRSFACWRLINVRAAKPLERGLREGRIHEHVLRTARASARTCPSSTKTLDRPGLAIRRSR